ncbi:hypothetical protein C0Q70_06608 [Pomacea canaliculata]|uniref:Amino acid transporter transmembrane domain-containing protein n=1 Tax=Pomacea canaliculata TaxID=400727 RepID=A0A2T7PCQ1_POMCA|nr:hypothetical protein C0Q70_06608 [Pomacea canaliculata]
MGMSGVSDLDISGRSDLLLPGAWLRRAAGPLQLQQVPQQLLQLTVVSRDALITSATNCLTSFLAGFVVFSVLGYMSFVQRRPIEQVARRAVATIGGASFWAIIFFFMIVTLGLDTTFGALEAVITGIMDEYPMLRRKRELFVAGIIAYCFLGSLVTTTYGGIYMVQLFDTYAAPISILLVVF